MATSQDRPYCMRSSKVLSIETLMRHIVAIPSISGHEEKLAIYVARLCQAMGHEVFAINGSIAVRIKGEVSQRTLIYNGHLDTVPGDWPGALELTARGDRLEGLGVTDMKGGLAVMLMKAQAYRFTPPPCDIWLFFSKEEETTAQGSIDLAAWWVQNFGGYYTFKAVLILEPTGNEYVAFGHKGGGVFRATIRGAQHHGATNLSGHFTAPKLACRLGVALERVQTNWLKKSDSFGVATVNLTGLAGYSADNVVTGAVKVWVDIRTNTTLTGSRLDTLFAKLNKKFGTDFRIDNMRDAGVVQSPSVEPLDHAFATSWPELQRSAFPAATDMNAFISQGLPVCIVGPGKTKAMHTEHEEIQRGAAEHCFTRLRGLATAFVYT
ncbi:MAG TPA: M20/M25/M40 family metallo-hydrolase [Candidatus Saccharimonadales bacterium]